MYLGVLQEYLSREKFIGIILKDFNAAKPGTVTVQSLILSVDRGLSSDLCGRFFFLAENYFEF